LLRSRENTEIFEQLRNVENLKGNCGGCEFRIVCMGCRARAYAATGDFLAEEPFCIYEPKMAELKPIRKDDKLELLR